jgi:hypothetical protein
MEDIMPGGDNEQILRAEILPDNYLRAPANIDNLLVCVPRLNGRVYLLYLECKVSAIGTMHACLVNPSIHPSYSRINDDTGVLEDPLQGQQ